MKVDFHFHMVNEYSLEEALIAYEHLADHYLLLLKRQSKCEFFFWKIAGVFFVSIIAALILQDKGFITNANILIFFAGMGSLLTFALNAKKDLKVSAKAAECVRKGILIEKQQKFTGGIFQASEDNKEFSRKGNLLIRNFIFWLLGLTTGVIGTALSLKIGLLQAVAVSMLSLATLFLISRLYVKISKKILLEGNP